MVNYNDVSYIDRAINRKKVLKVLLEPRTPTQVSKELKLNIGFITNIFIQLKNRNLIECLSPKEKRHRLYKITTKGTQILNEIEKLNK